MRAGSSASAVPDPTSTASTRSRSRCTHARASARVSGPVLYVSGGPLGWRVPDEDERLKGFAHAKHLDIDDAGHMMHWTKPVELASALVDFFA